MDNNNTRELKLMELPRWGLDVVDHGEDARLVDGRREFVRVQSIESNAFKHSWNSLVRLNRPFVEADENAFEVQNVFTVL